jgi:endonuclease YncB( thermonuclease family)
LAADAARAGWTVAATLVIAAASAPAGPANERARALSGDTLVYLGQEIRLRGVTCPNPDTANGRQAKALLATFLRRGFVSCNISPAVDGARLLAVCRVGGRIVAKGQSVNQGMRTSRLCGQPI